MVLYNFCCCSPTDHGNLLFIPIFLTPFLARNIDLAAVGRIYPNKAFAKIYLDASNITETEIQKQKGQKDRLCPRNCVVLFLFDLLGEGSKLVIFQLDKSEGDGTDLQKDLKMLYE